MFSLKKKKIDINVVCDLFTNNIMQFKHNLMHTHLSRYYNYIKKLVFNSAVISRKKLVGTSEKGLDNGANALTDCTLNFCKSCKISLKSPGLD